MEYRDSHADTMGNVIELRDGIINAEVVQQCLVSSTMVNISSALLQMLVSLQDAVHPQSISELSQYLK